MNGLQGRKVQNIESAIPGCLGGMVNLFDLGTAVSGNKLLTDKPHLDGSSLSKSRSDVARMPSPSYGDHTEAELIMSYLRRSASSKVNGTPMKKLIAREMSKEVEHKQAPTNVIARLMGLDNLPQLQHDTAAQRSKSNSYSRCSLNNLGVPVDHTAHMYQECSEFKDVYETWQPPQKVNCSRDSSPRKGRYDESMTEKQMALVRQKFMDAKRLVTDEKLHHSKEFQDALEVLSSNKDLFVKFLQESNSFFSQHLSEFQSVPPHPETKRITVLRPSKTVDTEKFVVQERRRNKQIKKPASSSQGIGWDNSNPGYSSSFVNRRAEERPAQPTRIVVLKPSPGKALDIKAAASSSPSSPGVLHGGDFFDEHGDVESREVAKEITRQMRENLMSHRRDETIFSSVFSNGYIGDDSSFNKSDNEYPPGNLSDSEVLSPCSRHSWDGVNRFGSPFSSSSFSRASFSPESSVCREAKKRLSERWASMALHGNIQQQKHVPRTSSTLGEMLALSETKAPAGAEEESSEAKPEARASTSFISSGLNQEESASESLKNFARSKSVPVSSTASGFSLNVETSVPETSNAQASRELTESRSLKSSWKVSNLFLFRNKKANKEKSDASQSSSGSKLVVPEPPSPMNLPGKTCDDSFPSADGVSLEECLSPDAFRQQSIYPCEEELTSAKLLMAGNSSENQDQPSPISVLQPLFEEEDSVMSECSRPTKPRTRGLEMSLKSNLIDKSPPIGSIARTLSWEDSCTDITRPSSTGIDEEQDWYIFIKTLLTASGLNGNVSSDSLLAWWHSTESPLDPLLRDKYANLNNKELIQEAKRRQQRSNRKLVFDCTNATIAEVTRTRTQALPFASSNKGRTDSTQPMNLADYVWTQLKDWFSGEVSRDACEAGDTNNLAAESVVRDEVVGRTWVDAFRIEMDNMGMEIEGKLLQELVEEAVIDLTQ